MHRFLLVMAVLAIGCVTAGTAFAQSSIEGGYGGRSAPAQDVLGEVGTVEEDTPSTGQAPTAAPAPQATAAAPESQAGPVTQAPDDGSLPFTGADAVIVGVGGALLLLGGVTLRRLARNPV